MGRYNWLFPMFLLLSWTLKRPCCLCKLVFWRTRHLVLCSVAQATVFCPFTQVTEKTDIHLDGLQTGLALWEKLQELGRGVYSWTESQLAAFTGGSRFQSQQEVAALLVRVSPLVTGCLPYASVI